MPKITILMPVFNGEKHLAETIDSVLSQSFPDFELLILNDGSTDDSEKIIKTFQAKDNRIVYLKNEKNLGIQKTLNKGLAFVKGDYLARIDSDDLWCDKNKLQKQLAFLEKNSDYALVGTAMEIIDETGTPLQKIIFPESDENIRQHILLSSQFAHPSVLLSAKALDEIGFYSQAKKHLHIEDYELWLRLGKQYKFANLPDVCLQYRLNQNGLSLQNQFRQRMAGLALTFQYRKDYPKATSAILIKLATLFVSRKHLDFLLKNSKICTKLYQQFTGTEKTP